MSQKRISNTAVKVTTKEGTWDEEKVGEAEALSQEFIVDLKLAETSKLYVSAGWSMSAHL